MSNNIPRVVLRPNNPYYRGTIYKFKKPNIHPLLRRKRVTYIPSSNDVLHTRIQGDTLFNLAGKYYEDSKKWFFIADANNVTDAFNIDQLDTIIIPDVERVKNIK